MGLAEDIKRALGRWRHDRRHAVLVVIVEVKPGQQEVTCHYTGPEGMDEQLASAVAKIYEERAAAAKGPIQ